MVIAALTACGNNKKVDTNSAEATEKEQVVGMHNTESSLNYWGVYKGTLLAADCLDIETTFTINTDSTYLMYSSYIDRNVELDEKGTYRLTVVTGPIPSVGVEILKDRVKKRQLGIDI